jgi:hypothetical protein
MSGKDGNAKNAKKQRKFLKFPLFCQSVAESVQPSEIFVFLPTLRNLRVLSFLYSYLRMSAILAREALSAGPKLARVATARMASSIQASARGEKANCSANN